MSKQPKLGIIAGSGELPRRIVAECKTTGRDIFVIAFEGITDASTTESIPHLTLNLGQVGKVIKTLRNEGVSEILMAGRVGRPALSGLKLDFSAMKLLAKFAKLPSQGDDKIFSTIIEFLEEKGFEVLGPDNVLSELLIKDGPFSSIAPDKHALHDIKIGMNAALTIGKLDIGQAVVIQNGQILGVEGAEGTDRLVTRCKNLHTEGPGGVLVKMKKPGQDPRVDLPSIGVYTIENAYASGLRGIAVEAGGALVINREDVKKKADELGLFIVGVPANPQ